MVGVGARGQGGDITIRAGALSLSKDGEINSTTFGLGSGGDIVIQVNSDVSLDSFSYIASDVMLGAVGNGGRIDLQSQSLNLTNSSSLSSSTFGGGNGGKVTVTSDSFEVISGGQLNTFTVGRGNAGNITLNVPSRIRLVGDKTGIFADTRPTSRGRGGSINITSTRDLMVQEQAEISVTSRGIGRAGNLTIKSDFVRLDQGSLTAELTADGGANITLQDLDLLLMRNGSQIDANAGNRANGGNITIGSQFIVAVPSEDSNIRANAVLGQGGNVQITTEGLFGIQPAMAPIPGVSDITASSEQGVQGAVTINQPNTDPSRGLIELPTIPIDATNQIAAACPTNAQEADRFGSFIVSGRGGLPPNPTDLLSEDNILTEWVTPNPEQLHAQLPPVQSETAGAIVEAQGLAMSPEGKVMLIAPDQASPPQQPATCQPQ